MREILFRGKRVDSGKWVQGYYVYDDSEQLTEKPRADIVRLHEHPCGFSMLPFEVIPETVGQYTGLTDKNGKKIFEGDIVKAVIVRNINERSDVRKEIGILEYDNMGMLSLVTRYHNDVPIYSDVFCELTLSNCVDDFWFEVIGNIHDTPELLKGGAE